MATPNYSGNPEDPGNPYDPPPPPPPPSYPPYFTTGSLPDATLNVSYAQTLGATSGTPPYTFSLATGTLPTGLTLTGAGVLAGTPTAIGNFSFILAVTDSAGLSSSAAFTLSVPSRPSIVNVSLPVATVGVPYFAAMTGTGGAAPYGFRAVGGALPAGLTLAATGGITGTPSAAGMFSVTIQIYDSGAPQGTGTASFGIDVQPATVLNAIRAMDAGVLLAKPDGGLYMVVPGQAHDTDYSGNPVAFLQRWQGVPSPSTKGTLMQMGGATISAKGNGALNVSAIAQDGAVVPITTDKRPMVLSATETTRDFMVIAAPKSERWAMVFDNGGVADAWFELHQAILWVRPFFGYRKA